MDEVYRSYRIAISEADGWVARITHVRGTPAPFTAQSTVAEGSAICGGRARELIDRYVEFLKVPDGRPPDG